MISEPRKKKAVTNQICFAQKFDRKKEVRRFFYALSRLGVNTREYRRGWLLQTTEDQFMSMMKASAEEYKDVSAFTKTYVGQLGEKMLIKMYFDAIPGLTVCNDHFKDLVAEIEAAVQNGAKRSQVKEMLNILPRLPARDLTALQVAKNSESVWKRDPEIARALTPADQSLLEDLLRKHNFP